MKIFLKLLMWFLLVLCLTIPVSISLSFSIGGKVATLLSAVWGLGCGFIATKLVL